MLSSLGAAQSRHRVSTAGPRLLALGRPETAGPGLESRSVDLGRIPMIF